MKASEIHGIFFFFERSVCRNSDNFCWLKILFVLQCWTLPIKRARKNTQFWKTLIFLSDWVGSSPNRLAFGSLSGTRWWRTWSLFILHWHVFVVCESWEECIVTIRGWSAFECMSILLVLSNVLTFLIGGMVHGRMDCGTKKMHHKICLSLHQLDDCRC